LKVRILSLALEELAAAAGYYQGKEHGLGKRFLDEYESAVGRFRALAGVEVEAVGADA